MNEKNYFTVVTSDTRTDVLAFLDELLKAHNMTALTQEIVSTKNTIAFVDGVYDLNRKALRFEIPDSNKEIRKALVKRFSSEAAFHGSCMQIA